MANNPLKVIGIAATAAIGVASAAYGAQKIVVNALSNTEVDFEFLTKEQFIIETRDGAKLMVYRDGPRSKTKPTLIFLHGFALCSAIWAHQFEELREQFDLVAIDIRGHGGSEAGDQGMTLELLANDLHDVITTLELVNVVFIGNSMGGVAAMAYLDQYPAHADKHVRGLGLVSTLAHPPYHHVENITEALAKFSLTGKAFHFFSEFPIVGFPMARFALGKKASNAVVEFVRRCVNSTDRQVCSDALKMLADFNYLETLEKFSSPALVVVGTSDPVTPIKDADIVARALGTKEIIIEDVGHAPMLESPDEFNAALGEFLNKIATL